VSKELEDLAKQFEAWRSSPTKGRRTPPELVVGVEQVLRTEPISVVARRLNIGASVIKQAQRLAISTIDVDSCSTDAVEHDNQFIELTAQVSQADNLPTAGKPAHTSDQALIPARIVLGPSSSILHIDLTVQQLLQVMSSGQGGICR
jgi:hypothetical protein